MENKIAILIEHVKKLPESKIDEALAFFEKIKEEARELNPNPACPHCKSPNTSRFGQVAKRQRYICKDCHKTFMEHANTVMSYSPYGDAVWKQVIRDTVKGVPLNETAKSLCMSHPTVFNMRHKILLAMEQEELRNPTVLSGVCELDDTYVLESYKGTKLPCDFWRKPRKHGDKAQKRGISNEYVCINTGVQRDGEAYSKSVTRATPSKEDIDAVFKGHIGEEILIVCDGTKSYNSFAENNNCPVMKIDGKKGFAHVNTANSFHSFIKERLNQCRGVATKYLNRYNSLYSKVFRNVEDCVEGIYKMLCRNDAPRHYRIKQTKPLNLLMI